METVKFKDVPRLVRRLRKERRYSYHDLSIVTGMSISQLFRIENGKIDISTQQLQVLSKAFGESWVLARIEK